MLAMEFSLFPEPRLPLEAFCPITGNLISGNTNYNLSIGNGVPDNSAVNVTAQGNFIGTDVTGTSNACRP